MRKHWGSYDNHFKEVYVAMNKYIERVLAELKEMSEKELRGRTKLRSRLMERGYVISEYKLRKLLKLVNSDLK